jgi:prevent-host-death family protein
MTEIAEHALKRCCVCRELKALSEFNRRTKAKDGLDSRCRACSNQATREWHAANPDKARATQLRNTPKKLAQMKAHHVRLKAEVLSHYGTCCACCGSIEDLSIDHVDGNGYEHREELFGNGRGGSDRLYRWLIQHNFPSGFQTLCRSCNSSKSRDGYCKMHSGEQPSQLTTRELRGRISACVDAASRGKPTVITKLGQPRAVLVSYDEWIVMSRVATGHAPIYALTHGLPDAAERPEIARGAPASVSKLVVRTAPRRLGR